MRKAEEIPYSERSAEIYRLWKEERLSTKEIGKRYGITEKVVHVRIRMEQERRGEWGR